MVGISNWIGADALGLEEQMGTSSESTIRGHLEDGCVVDMDRPEVIVYEDTTARSICQLP